MIHKRQGRLGTIPSQPAAAQSLCELLERRAAATPQRVAFTFLADDGGQQVITDGELDRRARAIAIALHEHAEPGDRAMLMFPPGLDFLMSFFGCLYAGILPVPSSYPKPRRPLPRHAAIARNCRARLALTNTQTLNLLNRSDDTLSNLHWLACDQLQDVPPPDWQPYAASADDVAFLQYTSGSTSEPKGVVLTHGNLLHNLEVIQEAFAVDRLHERDLERTSVFWLPAYHDMGLIGGLLGTIYTARHSVLMSPASFLQRPLRWLRAMSEYRASVSGAPNFAYELCVQRTTAAQRADLDLSHWQLAFCGAEPVQARTLESFAAAFADCGFRREAFYPCYGLAESSLMVTGRDGPSSWTTLSVRRRALAQNCVQLAEQDDPEDERQTVVGCGWPRCGQRVRIVDVNRGTACGADEVGEIWVQGDSVARGYWNQPPHAQDAFNGRLPGCDEPWLRTGDLGFIHEGELYVTGRLKDLIIIRGQNHYPQDIEATVSELDDALRVQGGAAFSVDSPRGERLVIVQELDRRFRDVDLQEVLRRIRVAVAVEHELEVFGVSLIREASLPRTSSGKVQRHLARQQFLEGSLQVLRQWQRSDDEARHAFPPLLLSSGPYSPADLQRLRQRIEGGLLRWLEQQAGIPADALQRDRPFAEMGIDSLSAVELSHALETWLHLELSPVMAWNFPTPARMATYLAHKVTGTPMPEEATEVVGGGFEALLAEIEAMAPDEVEEALRAAGRSGADGTPRR